MTTPSLHISQQSPPLELLVTHAQFLVTYSPPLTTSIKRCCKLPLSPYITFSRKNSTLSKKHKEEQKDKQGQKYPLLECGPES